MECQKYFLNISIQIWGISMVPQLNKLSLELLWIFPCQRVSTLNLQWEFNNIVELCTFVQMQRYFSAMWVEFDNSQWGG